MRLDGLDIARFLAFTGMVLVNFRLAAQVIPGNDWASLITHALEGRAAALFVVLAGIGFSLARMRLAIILKRAAFLMALGMLNQTIFEADILHFYALYFVVAALFAGRSQTVLFFGAIGFTLGWLFLAGIFDYEAGWDWSSLHYNGFWTLQGFLRHALFNGWHPVVPWAGFFLIGMWAAGLNLGNRSTQVWLAIGGAIVSLTTGIGANYIAILVPELAEIAQISPIPPGPFYMLAASASALSAIGVILLITPFLTQIGLGSWLKAAGRQSLTLYIAHILIGMGILEALGWLDGRLNPGQIFGISLGFCLFAALYAKAWFAKFKRGPLESAMRKIAG